MPLSGLFLKHSYPGVYIAFGDQEFPWSENGKFGRYWLGIYLKEKFQGRKIFDYLIGKKPPEECLKVDQTPTPAVNLRIVRANLQVNSWRWGLIYL